MAELKLVGRRGWWVAGRVPTTTFGYFTSVELPQYEREQRKEASSPLAFLVCHRSRAHTRDNDYINH